MNFPDEYFVAWVIRVDGKIERARNSQPIIHYSRESAEYRMRDLAGEYPSIVVEILEVHFCAEYMP